VCLTPVRRSAPFCPLAPRRSSRSHFNWLKGRNFPGVSLRAVPPSFRAYRSSCIPEKPYPEATKVGLLPKPGEKRNGRPGASKEFGCPPKSGATSPGKMPWPSTESVGLLAGSAGSSVKQLSFLGDRLPQLKLFAGAWVGNSDTG